MPQNICFAFSHFLERVVEILRTLVYNDSICSTLHSGMPMQIKSMSDILMA